MTKIQIVKIKVEEYWDYKEDVYKNLISVLDDTGWVEVSDEELEVIKNYINTLWENYRETERYILFEHLDQEKVKLTIESIKQEAEEEKKRLMEIERKRKKQEEKKKATLEKKKEERERKMLEKLQKKFGNSN